MNPLIVLPSYNERDNIVRLITALLNLPINATVCVVDDSSPDGTAAEIQNALAAHPQWNSRLHVIVRGKKDGRGGAVRDGFLWGLAQRNGFDAFVEMDCDFSHDPQAIPQGLSLLGQGTGVVLGSRYPKGEIIDWPVQRRVFSFFANALAKLFIARSIGDYTNGFRFYSRLAAEFLCQKPQTYRGYIYLSESLSYLLAGGFTVKEFPIRFVNRKRGKSNTDLREIWQALSGIFVIGWRYRTRAR